MKPSPAKPPFNKTGAAVAVRILRAADSGETPPFRALVR